MLFRSNGFPSPYSSTLRPESQDGLGLNPYAGSGDVTTQYWGESYLASDVQLARNAIVLLHHLCYASGNGEPGMAEPALSVAQQRVDNMAAGWLAAGARSVLVDAHYGNTWYIDQLFTSHRTIDALWRAAPSVQGHFTAFPSVRTPGMTAQMDPKATTSGFYRALTGDLRHTTDEVVGTALPPGDPTEAPTDTTAPALTPATSTSLSAATFSPNGDGLLDTVTLPLVLSEPAVMAIVVSTTSGDPVRVWSFAAPAGATTVIWDGRGSAGGFAPDGRYLLTVGATDAAGNVALALSKPLVLFKPLAFVKTSRAVIWPADPNRTAPSATRFSFVLGAPATVTWTVVDRTGGIVYTRLDQAGLDASTWTFVWNGRRNDGTLVPQGTYRQNVVASGSGVAIRTMTPIAVGAFGLVSSVASPARGTYLTLTATPAEPVAAAPTLRIAQTGVTTRTATMVKSGSVWVSRVWVASASSPGTLTLTVTGVDASGGTGSAKLALSVR